MFFVSVTNSKTTIRMGQKVVVFGEGKREGPLRWSVAAFTWSDLGLRHNFEAKVKSSRSF